MIYFVSDPIFTAHRTGMGHPEQPARTVVIDRALESAYLKTSDNTLKPRAATESEILLCHTPEYLKIVQDEIDALKGNPAIVYLSTGDAVISEHSYEAALFAAGGVLTAIDQIMNVESGKAFCSIRPPGHHACKSRGMGFCLFNNAAIGARYAQNQYGIRKVLIADWDVHHGNGTQDIFYSDPSVFYFSTHEEGLYPQTGFKDETGEGAGKGYTWNCPILSGKNSRLEVIEAFEQLREKMREYKPELVIISAGFDAHENDPLGHFNLTDADFKTLSKVVKDIADEHAGGRVVSVLEGGYNLRALATASVAHVDGLL